MTSPWQLQEAKNRFSKVVEDALREGPQTVTRRGEPVVVVVSVDTWRELMESRPGLKEYLRAGSLEGLELSRESEERREVSLP